MAVSSDEFWSKALKNRFLDSLCSKQLKKQLVLGPKLQKRKKLSKPGIEPRITTLIFHTPPTEPPPTDRFTTLAVKVILIHLTVMAMPRTINEPTDSTSVGA